jgi:hypothetical protein
VTDRKTMSKRAIAWLIISAAVPLIGAAAATHLFAVARGFPPPESDPNVEPLPLWETDAPWYGAAAACAGVAVLVAVLAKVLDARKKSALELANETQASDLAAAAAQKLKAVEAAQLLQLIRLHDELIPVAATTADMARHPLEERGPYLSGIAQVAATALSALVATHVDRPRAAIFSLDPDATPIIMKSIGHKGRGRHPRPFKAGTARGDAAIEFAFATEPQSYHDLTKKKPAGYVGSMSDYKTFIAVPIWTESGSYGMVTLDAPEPDSFNDGDLALTKLVAEIMSIAFEVGQDQNFPEPLTADSAVP